MSVASPLKWHGGKAYLAKRIVALMPSHLHYVEPFAGGLTVLLAKNPEGVSEVVNDLNGELTCFWKVLQEEDQFQQFRRLCEATPFSEREWQESRWVELYADCDWPKAAWSFFIRCRQSLAGRMDTFAPLSRTRTRRGMNEQVAAWLTAVEGLPAVHERLKRVVIFNRPALDVIRQQDGGQTLFYCDPPYHPSTRAAPTVYTHEMSADDHAALLDQLRACQGKVMLSGYRCQAYDDSLKDWHRVDFDLPNNAASGKSKRRMTESLWCNFKPGMGDAA